MEGEPAEAPPLPDVGPFVQRPAKGDGVGRASLALASTRRRIGRGGRSGSETGEVQRDATERVWHLPRPHRDRVENSERITDATGVNIYMVAPRGRRDGGRRR